MLIHTGAHNRAVVLSRQSVAGRWSEKYQEIGAEGHGDLEQCSVIQKATSRLVVMRIGLKFTKSLAVNDLVILKLTYYLYCFQAVINCIFSPVQHVLLYNSSILRPKSSEHATSTDAMN
jgi:hypothetical protein